MAFIYADRVKETTTTTGTGTINLAGAAAGFQTFVAGIGNANTCPYVIVDADGSGWEQGIGTVTDATPDTLARTTVLASSNAGSAITLSSGTHSVFCAWPASRARQSALEHVAGTDAATTMAVGQMYVVDMSAWATADRTYTLPATAAVGDRVGIMISAGNASTFELDVTAGSGDTLNGVAGGTAWSRLFITGEVIIMRCVAANSAWIVEYDGRIPCKCRLERNTNLAVTAATVTHLAYDVEIYDVGDIGSASTGDITARRAGKYLFTVFHGIDTQIDAGTVESRLYTNALGAVLAYGTAPFVRLTSGNAICRADLVRTLTLAAGDIVEGAVIASATGNTQEGATTYNPFIEVVEILP